VIKIDSIVGRPNREGDWYCDSLKHRLAGVTLTIFRRFVSLCENYAVRFVQTRPISKPQLFH
jgi:hypothetical protein